MSVDTAIILIGIIIGFGVISFLLLKKSSSQSDRVLLEWLKAMQETVQGSTAQTNRVLASNTEQLNDRLDNAAHVIGELKKHIGELSEVGRGIKDLQAFLQSPKLRGGLGEEILADMIAQLFPKQAYALQYAFKSGVKVDAIIKTDAGILCIDAKFPMNHFVAMHDAELEIERSRAKKEFIADVKKHLTDISRKYILPQEGTLDFALMYIPSEAVYYEIVMTPEIMTLARKERIYPVSPNTLYAHLQVLLVGFQGKELEKKTHEVIAMLRSISQEYEAISQQYAVLSKHITNTYNANTAVGSGLNQLGNTIAQTKRLGDGE